MTHIEITPSMIPPFSPELSREDIAAIAYNTISPNADPTLVTRESLAGPITTEASQAVTDQTEYTPYQIPPQKKFSAKNVWKRTKQAAILATIGGGAYATATNYSPNPEVSSGGTEALISANDFLLDNGETGLITVAGLAGVVTIARFSNRRTKEMVEMTKPSSGTKEKHWSRKILPPLLVTATAVGAGLGVEAGRGANEPVDAIVSAMGVDAANTFAVVGNEDVLPFNHSSVSKVDVEKLMEIADEDTQVVPFYMQLGSAQNLENAANPSSAGIIALPEELLPAITESTIEVPSDTMRVLTTAQFASVGDEISVQGRPAIVVGTTDTYPGLDRTSVITPNEDLEDVVLAEDEPVFGVMISGVRNEADLQEFLQENNINAAEIPVEEWQEAYNNFWDRSVTPVTMQYMLLIAGIGSVGASFMRRSDILNRRKDLGIQNVMGVSKASEARAEYMRAALDTAKATAYAAAPAIGLIAITNSAQYGVSLEASASSLGAGAILVGSSLFLSTFAANRTIHNMDSVNEVR